MTKRNAMQTFFQLQIYFTYFTDKNRRDNYKNPLLRKRTGKECVL
jgi:hypothetical protein